MNTRVEKVRVDTELSVAAVLDVIQQYEELYKEKPNTLIYSSSIDYAPAIFYSTDAMCLTIRLTLRHAVPIPDIMSSWWAIAGKEGLIYSPGCMG